MYTMIMTMSKTYEGGGFYVLLGVLRSRVRPFVTGRSHGVVPHPIVYQFCANWDDTKKVVPEKFDEMNKFCGVRLLFRSESREQLRKLPGDYVTNYDRIPADGCSRDSASPTASSIAAAWSSRRMQGESSDAVGPQVQHLALVPGARSLAAHQLHRQRGLVTGSPRPALGTVLYSTPLLWEYAYARRERRVSRATNCSRCCTPGTEVNYLAWRKVRL
jgi:hypothetical protein